MRRFVCLLAVLSLACGIVSIPPAVVGSLPTDEIMPAFAQKSGVHATFTRPPVILCVSAVKSLNLRIAPSTSAPADPDGLAYGDPVTVTGYAGNWYQVAVSDGRRGWVNGEYLERCKK